MPRREKRWPTSSLELTIHCRSESLISGIDRTKYPQPPLRAGWSLAQVHLNSVIKSTRLLLEIGLDHVITIIEAMKKEKWGYKMWTDSFILCCGDINTFFCTKKIFFKVKIISPDLITDSVKSYEKLK